ncbi:MAG: tRNA (adenosine(37)-N6)-threonylcarbamoyltransferase complex ATPase subunit type 1 TsaE [Actinomycetota bacterium]|nr:tRNA (adenosine(37)-N6)-threonylcarbamoyltransferase complex ATPase subunit type 1 TsaE [Actinomycetota bacterium]
MSGARSSSAGETERVGARLADRLKAGDLVLVTGELGAGKTTFVRGAFRALGMSGPVVSPTFTIGRLYEGRDGVRLSHLDLYRLADLGAEDPGLLEDYLTPDAIAFVEWPAVALVELPEPTVRVAISHAGGDERDIRVEWAQ